MTERMVLIKKKTLPKLS